MDNKTPIRWITDKQWNDCAFSVDAEALKGRRCHLSFDISNIYIMGAMVLCFPPEKKGERYQFIFKFYVPKKGLERAFRTKTMLDSIKRWIKQGFITAYPGSAINSAFVIKDIKKYDKLYKIQEILYDGWNSTSMINGLITEGFIEKLKDVPQGVMHFSGPSKDFKAKILKKEIAHGGNPVMNGMMSCTEIQQDLNLNIMPIRPTNNFTPKRIEGVIAAIMSLDGAVKNENIIFKKENREKSNVKEKSWEEFRNTGLLLYINQVLHIFGWAIVYEFENKKIHKVYPARVKFRGFSEKLITESYLDITKYLKKNINKLLGEAEK